MTRRVTRSKKSRPSFQNSETLRLILREIRAGRSFLVATHVNPDGDALGSALALGLGLKRLGKRVKIYSADPVPGNLRFLPGAERVTALLTVQERFDAAFLVDCAEPERAGETFFQHPRRGRLIVIDHHRRGGRGGEINLIEPAAASTGTIVLKLVKKLRVPVGREIAVNVYTTLVTDTGNFRYSNTSPSVLRLAADLMEKGVSPWQVSRHLYDSYPPARLQLLAKVLPTLVVSRDGRSASIVLTEEMFRETGASVDLADEFINYPRSIDTVEVAIQFREADGKWKVSLRSKERVDVAMLAARFGGGGHARAAGCTLEETLEAAREKIFRAVEEALQRVF